MLHTLDPFPYAEVMRLAFLLFGLCTVLGCMLFDLEEEASPDPAPATSLALNSSCTDLWKHYTDELQLINDDEANWSTHDDNAVQYLSQFSGSCTWPTHGRALHQTFGARRYGIFM
ncbi:hypothetical protein [Nitrospira sp. Nam74]